MNLDIVNEKKFILADGHIFKTVNGEGYFLGVPSIFIRFAGCSVGCKFCDTKYGVDKVEFTVEEIEKKIKSSDNYGIDWIWITGGEPTDQDVGFLVKELKKRCHHKIAIATSGIRSVEDIPFDFISVSPHGTPDDLFFHNGDQINLVPNLNFLGISKWATYDFSGFKNKWITPMADKDGGINQDSLSLCLNWVKIRPEFRLGIQAHKFWRIA